MKIKPNWRVAVGVYLVYNAIIFATWAAVGADYRDLSSAPVALQRLVLPLGLGALFVAMAVTQLGWWRVTMMENIPKPAARWPLWVLPSTMLGLILANAAAIHWSAIAPSHLAMLIAATVMVGFNEEMVTRGIVVTGLRGSGRGEVGVWFWSSLLFGAMHVPNALFGLSLIAGLVQALFAFLMGCAFYALRRTSGALWLPMVLHGLWDFSSLSLQASGGAYSVAAYFQFASYFLAVLAVISVLRRKRTVV